MAFDPYLEKHPVGRRQFLRASTGAGVVALSSSSANLDRTAVHELLAV